MSYAATQTSDVAYIIGGSYTKNVVAQFKDGQWRKLKDLNQGRDSHGAITIETQTMIVGGEIYLGNYDAQTEVWQLETGSNKIIGPTVYGHIYGVGLYAVNFDYCSK